MRRPAGMRERWLNGPTRQQDCASPKREIARIAELTREGNYHLRDPKGGGLNNPERMALRLCTRWRCGRYELGVLHPAWPLCKALFSSQCESRHP